MVWGCLEQWHSHLLLVKTCTAEQHASLEKKPNAPVPGAGKSPIHRAALCSSLIFTLSVQKQSTHNLLHYPSVTMTLKKADRSLSLLNTDQEHSLSCHREDTQAFSRTFHCLDHMENKPGCCSNVPIKAAFRSSFVRVWTEELALETTTRRLQLSHQIKNPNANTEQKISYIFSGIVQNPERKDGKNCRLGLQTPLCQYCWYSLHISDWKCSWLTALKSKASHVCH